MCKSYKILKLSCKIIIYALYYHKQKYSDFKSNKTKDPCAMIVKTFLFAFLLSLSYLENADAYLEKSPANDIFQQGSMSELETLQEKIAEHPQQWRRWRGRRWFPRPYPIYPYPRYPYPPYPVPVPVPAPVPFHSPYCSYHPLDLPPRLKSRLFRAICDGATRSARDIIRHGGISPHRSWVTGETPLMLAAQTGNFELVEMLVEEFGVDWRRRDQWGHTAADWAYENGYDDIGDYLCDL